MKGCYSYMKKASLLLLFSLLSAFVFSGNVYAETLRSGKTYIIRSAMDNNYVFDVYYGLRLDMRGKNVQLYHYHGGDNQQFKILSAGNNWYKIINVKTNKAIDVAGGIAGDEVNVQLWEQNGTDAQLFRFEDAGNGYLYIKNKLGYYLDVYWGVCRDEQNIQTCRKNGGNNQKWLLTSVGGTNNVTDNITDNVWQDLLKDAEDCMKELETEFITQLCKDANGQKSESIQNLRKQINAHRTSFSANKKKYTSSTIPDEVYETFARAVLDSITGGNVNRYNFDFDKQTQLPEQVYRQLKKGMNSDNFTLTLGNGSDRRTYTVRYNIAAMGFLGIGAGVAKATVSWRESYGQESWELTWASDTETGLRAMANYCAVLLQLELDVWKDFLASFVSDMFGLKKKNVRNVLYVAENVIMAIRGDSNAASELANGTNNRKLKELIKAGLDKFVIKFFPNGKKFVDVTQKFDSAIRRRKELQKALADYNSDKDKKKADAEISYVYKRFKADYYKLKEIDLFNGRFPELNVKGYSFPDL